VQLTETSTSGGRGYFGTVQAGCDYQFSLGTYNLVIGAFGDYDFSDISGKLNPPSAPLLFGNEKLSSTWSAGGRIGWLVNPSLLAYFSAGYTEASFDQVDFHFNLTPPPARYFPKNTYKGYFLGAGDEYALSLLPGLFWKTEYRLSRFDTESNPLYVTGTNTLTAFTWDSTKWVHTIRSELVYRFNWGGPVVAKY
jgi:outer membrane immunogenic protein